MTHVPKAFITGVAGQDGSYLAELLLEKGYDVHGLVRQRVTGGKSESLSRIGHLVQEKKITLHYGDITSHETLRKIIRELQPDEIYHLAAITVSKIDFEKEAAILEHNLNSVLCLLRSIKEYSPASRFFFAASATMYGNNPPMPQDESTPFRPTTPYAIAKTAAFYLVKMYRDAHGIFAASGILFNHESPRRGPEFVTRKISTIAARIKLGLERELVLGNLDAERDWSFAGDYARAFWLMLQAGKPDDYVIGSGEKHTVREFVEKTFKFLNLDYRKYVKSDPSLLRSEATVLLSNPAKVRRILHWEPKVSFDELVKMMVDSDLENEKKKKRS